MRTYYEVEDHDEPMADEEQAIHDYDIGYCHFPQIYSDWENMNIGYQPRFTIKPSEPHRPSDNIGSRNLVREPISSNTFKKRWVAPPPINTNSDSDSDSD